MSALLMPKPSQIVREAIAIGEWPAVQVNDNYSLPEKYIGLLDWVLDEPSEGFTEEEEDEEVKNSASALVVAVSSEAAKEKHADDDMMPQTCASPVNVSQENVAEFANEGQTSPTIHKPEQSPPVADINASSWKLSTLDEALDGQDGEKTGENLPSNAKSASRESKPGGASPQALTQNHSTSVEAWAMNTPDGPVSMALDLKTEQSSTQCLDIDPETGALLPAVEYPETRLNRDLDAEAETDWRRRNMTSEMQIRREITVRARIAERVKRARRPLEPETTSPSSDEKKAIFPSANCSIRPVAKSDIGNIVDLMKAQKRCKDGQSQNVLPAETMTRQSIEKLITQCKKDHCPFIVATVGGGEKLLDRSKWPVGTDWEYKQYLEYCKSSSAPKSVTVGFAFASSRPVFNNSCQAYYTNRSCYITLFVRPSHRNKKYGSALLDRILLSVSRVHRSLIDFHWKCDEPCNVYESLASHNAQQYSRVFVEYLDMHQDDERLPGPRQLLEKFGFKQVGHLTCVGSKDKEGKRRRWLDLFIWELAGGSLKEID